jgi:tryptophan-rich sensory protein
MRRINLILFAVFFLSASSIFKLHASPAMEQIVVNQSTQECGIFWAGDEFQQYDVPNGWEIYKENPITTINTPYGKCSSDKSDPQEFSEYCCKQFGLKYIDYKNIPITETLVARRGENQWKCVSEKYNRNGNLGVNINASTGECSSLIGFGLHFNNSTMFPTEQECKITDPNWISYEERFGKNENIANACTFGGQYNIENCCKKLGLNFIGRARNITKSTNSDMFNSSTWYATLLKPSWAPPSWLFGPVWTVLYIFIAISFGYVFYNVFKGKFKAKVALPFVLNIIFNLLFTPIQFGLRSNLLAAVDIILVLATLIWALVTIYPIKKWVALINMTYLAWVLFATILQFTITFLNF